MTCVSGYAITDMNMRLNDEELSRLYRQKTRRSGGNAQACLPDELLIQAVSGKLGPRDHEKVVQHLSICSDCATEYRLTRSIQLADAFAGAENQARSSAAKAVRKKRPWSFWMLSAAAPVGGLALPPLTAPRAA